MEDPQSEEEHSIQIKIDPCVPFKILTLLISLKKGIRILSHESHFKDIIKLKFEFEIRTRSIETVDPQTLNSRIPFDFLIAYTDECGLMILKFYFKELPKLSSNQLQIYPVMIAHLMVEFEDATTVIIREMSDFSQIWKKIEKQDFRFFRIFSFGDRDVFWETSIKSLEKIASVRTTFSIPNNLFSIKEVLYRLIFLLLRIPLDFGKRLRTVVFRKEKEIIIYFLSNSVTLCNNFVINTKNRLCNLPSIESNLVAKFQTKIYHQKFKDFANELLKNTDKIIKILRIKNKMDSMAFRFLYSIVHPALISTVINYLLEKQNGIFGLLMIPLKESNSYFFYLQLSSSVTDEYPLDETFSICFTCEKFDDYKSLLNDKLLFLEQHG